MEEINEPIKIEMYGCPKCKARIEGTYEQAQKPVQVPIDTPLPRGLIIVESEDVVWKQYIMILRETNKLSRNHGLSQPALWINYSESDDRLYLPNYLKRLYRIDSPRKVSINSRDIKEGFKEGIYSILTKEDFEKIPNIFFQELTQFYNLLKLTERKNIEYL